MKESRRSISVPTGSGRAGAEAFGSTDRSTNDEAPPFGDRWVVLYAIVLIFLAFQIAVFTLFTNLYR